MEMYCKRNRQAFLNAAEGEFELEPSPNVCAISGGGGSSRSAQSSEGEAGVSGPDRAFATGRAFNQLGELGPIIASFMQNVPQLQLNQQGLTSGQAGMANSLVSGAANSLFSKLSGSGALRGQLSERNTSGIIGSASERAAASVLPQLIQTSGANTLFNTQAGQLTQGAGIGFLQQLASQFGDLAKGGSSQNSEGSSSASNFNFGIVS